MAQTVEPARSPTLSVDRVGDTARVTLAGDWLIRNPAPDAQALIDELRQSTVRRLAFDVSGLGRWDSRLLTFVLRVFEACEETRIELDAKTLPEGLNGIIALARAVPEKDIGPRSSRTGLLHKLGEKSLDYARGTKEAVEFIGEATIAVGRMFAGVARYRRSDVFLLIQQCGADALPIVTLISFLVGLIMAYVGAVQLQQFGATLFVANLVGLAMVREMGAMMSGIIMCGRTGAAFAAQLGSMKVSEEISALRTLGLSPMEFLVVPRMIALFVMMPLLTLYSDFIGMLGGMLVTWSMGITTVQFVKQVTGSITLVSFLTGIIKSTVFGLIVAITGCLGGMQCGSSSAAVGEAATSAVVSGITWLIIADAVFTVLFNVLNI